MSPNRSRFFLAVLVYDAFSLVARLLYISLGGSRNGAGRTQINLTPTMLFGEIRHGASRNFVILGGLHGAYIAIERSIQKAAPGLELGSQDHARISRSD